MDVTRLYDRYAQPHLPRTDAYSATLRAGFCENAHVLIEWLLDEQAVVLGQASEGAAFPLEAVSAHVRAIAKTLPGSILTSVVPYDRLGQMVDAGNEDMFGAMMVELAVLHLVRAADAVSVGITNSRPGRKVDVTSPARGQLSRMVAARAARRVMIHMVDEMPVMNAIAYAAAATWTKRTLQ